MSVPWIWVTIACAVACAGAERGGSLRGALEALQRRQRGRYHIPPSVPDYDSLYEFLPPQTYPEPDYAIENDNVENGDTPKYIIKYLESQRHPPEVYEYKVVKKKSFHTEQEKPNTNKESPFRERSQHSDNERLRDLFTDRNDEGEDRQSQERKENDAEYAMLLGELWSKYKSNRRHASLGNVEVQPNGVVKLYKDKSIRKRIPDNWGPIAFKKKRSPESDSDINNRRSNDYVTGMGSMAARFEEENPIESNYNSPDDKNDADLRDEYAIAFQPLDDEPINDLSNDDRYAYEVEKRFPVTKRSSPFVTGKNYHKKRSAQEDNKYKSFRNFRSSAGTDPKIIKDLSEIFGESSDEIIKSPVKRSSNNDENSHEITPPQITAFVDNSTHAHNSTQVREDDSHEHHGHNMHHPGMSQEVEDIHSTNTDKPIIIKKKSIDWSDYFGIDRRKKKSFVNNMNQDRLRKQYFDTFNKEVIYPSNSFRKHSQVKRNYEENKPRDEKENHGEMSRAHQNSDNRKDTDSKLDDIDKQLRNMESIIVDEALHYSNIGEELDSKEEQEVKEKLLSRLAAAYSLEKMRKAMKEFQQSLKMQKNLDKFTATSEVNEEKKSKRLSIKKEKAEISENDIPIYSNSKVKQTDDFEGEQGAGHYINGRNEEQFSEGYMGGSGRHRTPAISMVGGDGSCPVLEKIVQRCRGVDLLAGDRGQLFLPLCSLHQICYLCAEAPPTTCDLVFISEADTVCESDMACQRAARSSLMALRELYDALSDELDGECEASPCLPATLKLNHSWQRALNE